MNILGISCYYHDAAAALLQDGLLTAAAEEERFSRRKHDSGFPRNAVDFCLSRAKIGRRELDYVVFYEKPILKFERIFITSLSTFPRSWRMFGEAMISWLEEKLWIKSKLQKEFGLPGEKILFADHHISHAASSFLCSPFEEAAILTVDGVGEWATATMGRGKASWNGDGRTDIHLSRDMRFPHSLGLLYSAFTAFLGFEVNEGEYKVMGMAPYGQPRYQDRVHKLMEVYEDGSFWLNMDYFSFHYSHEQTISKKFIELFGEPRDPNSEFATQLTGYDVPMSKSAIERNQYYADVAASIQAVTEEILLKMAKRLFDETGLKNLCMAGGVALNSVANGRILRETPFENLFINPAPGDSGGAVGACLYAWHVLLGKQRRFVMEHAYLGQDFSSTEVVSALRQNNVAFETYEDDEALLDRVADAIAEGKVIGWFQGRAEWGPRALGNRSILADPRRSEMKHIVNSKIKFREPFRPFAPVILEERAHEFFDDLPDASRHFGARFMLLVMPWKAAAADLVPAVNHMGTGRLQTVRREWNPRYYRLVEKFGQRTGVPVLMNTSFNLRGEPIVNSPQNAINTFRKSGIDMLVIENHVAVKSCSETQGD